jgi:AAA15 family ATPase/GTPase
MLPGRFSRMSDHVINTNGIELLKLNAIYGANGAGKSNLIYALTLLKDFLIKGSIPIQFITETFKFDKESHSKDVYLGVEFIKDNIPFYYGLTINKGIIIEEELQISGLGKKEDKVLFLRTDKIDRKELDITFSDEVLNDPEASQFPPFLKNEILERDKPVLYYMKNRQNKAFEYFKNAIDWFDKDLVLIMPDSRPGAMVLQLEKNKALYAFAIDVMKSFNTGVTDIHIETIPINDFFGEDDKQEAERMTAELKAKPGMAKFLRSEYEDVAVVLEDNKPVVKRITFSHGEEGSNSRFQLSEESDGTRRLLEYLPALYGVVNTRKTFFIDEIERSLHPLLVKELIRKFSHDPEAKGQLIFSTHESNLLDQEIFRPDEIWFAEKNKQGATELYALSEFKEHHTINIRNGYLTGRYGGIPFLGDLKNLNWEKYAQAI